ncbi:hypothetical protein BDP55DRAFT_640137 [Colletotrichum godetiae]|uniref:Uncharacterized protein n=1 Tax=Colletotrichum godetiae TaxID=1209918 RepID=A0AAJ0B052_9PEZI|nr:uncharacterized protein BDP55DRAFT_640137 [Colletotrichum godetiae]KAK1701008.1 hypothetical protein BDP55DRAFT_640137 [Colletotrichum godetiae]
MDSPSKRQNSRRHSEARVQPQHRSTATSPYAQVPVQTGSSIYPSNPSALPPYHENSGQGFPAFGTQSAVGYTQSDRYPPAYHNMNTMAYLYSHSAPAYSMTFYPPMPPVPNYGGPSYGSQPASTQAFVSSSPHHSHPNSPLMSYSDFSGHSSAASSYGYAYAASSATTTPSAANTPTQPLSPTLVGVGAWDHRQPIEDDQEPRVERNHREGRRLHHTEFPSKSKRSESTEVNRSSSHSREVDIYTKRNGGRSSASCNDDRKNSNARHRKDDDKDDSRKGSERRQYSGSNRRETRTY